MKEKEQAPSHKQVAFKRRASVGGVHTPTGESVAGAGYSDFEIEHELGQSRLAVVYAARDRRTGERVVLKKFSLARSFATNREIDTLSAKTRSEKMVELFRREAEVLRNLDHPRIPRYLAHFTRHTDDDLEIYIVQELIPGRTLEDWIADGRRFITRYGDFA